ncbi:hypothetical protein TNCV_3693981 [Trichonephila clavipes]|nr:hypothetical protein TNCV_3693981 [Trichonephila clavipes]
MNVFNCFDGDTAYIIGEFGWMTSVDVEAAENLLTNSDVIVLKRSYCRNRCTLWTKPCFSWGKMYIEPKSMSHFKAFENKITSIIGKEYCCFQMYTVVLEKQATKQLARLQELWWKQATEALEDLANEEAKWIKLKDNKKASYRIRKGNLRILFSIDKNLISVLSIEFRTDHTYKR